MQYHTPVKIPVREWLGDKRFSSYLGLSTARFKSSFSLASVHHCGYRHSKWNGTV
jgi:hypothetical protein